MTTVSKLSVTSVESAVEPLNSKAINHILKIFTNIPLNTFPLRGSFWVATLNSYFVKAE